MPKQKTEQFPGQCPFCHKDIILNIPRPDDPCELAPVLAADKLRPVSNIYVYKISSDQIKEFVLNKVREYSPNASMELVSKYCERKRTKKNEPRHSYASFRIAFSEDVIKKDNSDGSWFASLGESESGGISYVNSKLGELVDRYRYRRRDVDNWLKSYKSMEELENGLGMTEVFISDIKKFSTPQRVKTVDHRDWIMFAAEPLSIIKDMLADGETHQPTGAVKIVDVYPISKEVVEFTVHVVSKEVDLKENRHVRQILSGDEKLRK